MCVCAGVCVSLYVCVVVTHGQRVRRTATNKAAPRRRLIGNEDKTGQELKLAVGMEMKIGMEVEVDMVMVVVMGVT